MRALIVAIAITVATSASTPAAAAAPELRAVHIASRVGDSGPATDRAKRARADQTVTLFAVLEARDRGRRVYFSDAPALILGGRAIAARPLAEAPFALWIWKKLEPTAESMSNTESGRFRFERIEYGESIPLVWLGRRSVRADVRPTLTTDRGDGVGTMRYRLVAIAGGRVLATAGEEARRGSGSGGLTDAVHRITVRRDDSYIGYLTELYGQPYIWASGGSNGRRHQSERLEGSDCADFVVYGKRRAGVALPYTWTGALPEHADLLARGEADGDGIYRDNDGEPIAFTAVGDLVLFPRHVGVLTADRGRRGVLDHADVMMHSYFASPREQSLGDSAYASTWIEVRRWRR